MSRVEIIALSKPVRKEGTLWYQVPSFSSSANVDLIAIYLTTLGTLLLLAVPFLPGLRDIPRWIPVHRLVWRDWNRTGANNDSDARSSSAAPTPESSESSAPSG
jgi:hypothetical protein